MSNLWIQNGRIIDPKNKRDEIADLYVKDGRITESLSEDEKANAEVFDGTGYVVAPGLVDIHVHLREPGQTHKEDIETGSRSAAAGGFTTIVAMPNTSPACDNIGTIQQIKDRIETKSLVKIHPTGCITVGRKGEQLANIGSFHKAGCVAITDDGDCVQDNEIMRRALEYAKMFDLCIMDHCQDYSLTQGAVMHEGAVSLKLGLKGWPSAAEEIIVARNIILSRATGGHVHLQHISAKESIPLIREAKKDGVRITAEAMPHHMSLTDENLSGYNTNFKMNPPLRTEEDRKAIALAVKEGVLDCIATDHAPHADDEKDQEIDKAPFGIIGLETALPVVLESLYHTELADEKCSLGQIISALTDKPADILGLDAGHLSNGAAADIALLDVDESWLVDAQEFESKSSNCPWHGQRMRGRVKKTFVDGVMVYDGRSIVSRPAQS